MSPTPWIAWTTLAIESLGVATIALGVVSAMGAGAVSTVKVDGAEGFRVLRGYLGKAIALSLEFFVAADVLRTVTEEPTIDRIATLGLIVLVRTFVSFTLYAELEGHWPWQRTPGPIR